MGKLADTLNQAIDKMVSDDKNRADIVAEMANAAGIEPNTVNQILNSQITTPPAPRLQGFARVLNISADTLMRLAGHTEESLLFLEASITPSDGDELTGREWDVTIIGATDDPESVIELDGEKFIRSRNGRLYSSQAIADSVGLWDGVKVYDNHLTQAEFEQKQGMRSPAKEWLGTIVKPRWDKAKQQLRGVFKVVDEALAAKLKNAFEQGILKSVGLSIDTFPIIDREAIIEGARTPIIGGFKKILSVDLVGDPAAGGGFNRIIAANITEEIDMTKDEITALVKDTVTDSVKAALADALAAEAEALEEAETDEVEQNEEADTQERDMKHKKAGDDEDDDEDEDKDKKESNVSETLKSLQLAQAKLMLDMRVAEAKLTGKHARLVRNAFQGRIYEDKELSAMIDLAKEAQADGDATGRVNGAGSAKVQSVLTPEDKLQIEFARLVMGNVQFRNLESNDETFVTDRLKEVAAYKSWINAGKPNTGGYRRVSELVYDLFGGDPLIDNRVYEAASTSTLATVVKNTVNIMVAADYSLQQRWYEPLVTVEEVDTIDDATLARLYGVNTLSVVSEGAAYTELALTDEEETAQFVKRGNWVGVTLEVMMRDKINFIRTIPRRLSDAWFNTLSELTANVFTVNTAAGPVLADTGALFNSTAATTAGGHANLRTTALSFTEYSAVRTAMRVQTNQALGVGRRMQISPRYLLVPEDLETTALQIRNSELLPGSANNDVNPFFQQFDVITIPDWTDANDWATIGDPSRFPAIYHIFPRGGRTPQLFTANDEASGSMFTNDTLRFKVRMLTYRFSATYDCAPVADFRPLHKSNVT